MALYNTGGQNISGQFGLPIFGISGNNVPGPFTGNYFWVDGTFGSDGNTGGPQDPLKTLTQAQNKCLAGNNDVVFFTGSFSPTATFVWSKNNTHLIGLCGDSVITKSIITVANTAATSGAFTPLVSVTASGCIFSNITAVSGIAQAAAQVCWADSGGQNTYYNCYFNQVGNATAAAQAGNVALALSALGNYFYQCTIGGDAVVRATGNNVTVSMLATAGAMIFRQCTFQMWSSNTANVHINAAATTMSGNVILDQCSLIQDLQNAGAVTLAAAITASGTAGGIFLLTPSTLSVGATAIATTGPVYGGAPVPTATTSGIAIPLT